MRLVGYVWLLYSTFGRGREARSRQNKCSYARKKARQDSPVHIEAGILPTSSQTDTVPEDILQWAHIPHTADSCTSAEKSYPDLGLWSEPFQLQIPEDYMDPTLADELFEGPDPDIPQFTANLEAVQRRKLKEAGWERFHSLDSAEEIRDCMRRELDMRRLSWEKFGTNEVRVTEHGDVAWHVGKKWMAKAILSLLLELEMQERGWMDYLEAVDTEVMFWQRS